MRDEISETSPGVLEFPIFDVVDDVEVSQWLVHLVMQQDLDP